MRVGSSAMMKTARRGGPWRDDLCLCPAERLMGDTWPGSLGRSGSLTVASHLQGARSGFRAPDSLRLHGHFGHLISTVKRDSASDMYPGRSCDLPSA
jgi:hypothetical protein